MASDLDSHAVCQLTTTGRLTGRPHRIEIWFALAQRTMYVLAGGGWGPDWVRNLRASPAASVEIGESGFTGRARFLTDDRAEERLARDVVYAKYQPRYRGDLSRWREAALPVAIDLSDTA